MVPIVMVVMLTAIEVAGEPYNLSKLDYLQ